MTLVLHEHPFASYCWKARIALYERDVPWTSVLADADGRTRLSELWPPASIPVLVDDEAGLTIPESSTIVEYLDAIGAAPPLIPRDPAQALQVRLWDRVLDGHVQTPMQKIVGDALRAPEERDPTGVAQARAALDQAYALLDRQLGHGGPWAIGEAFTLADCAAGPALFYGDVVHRWDAERLPRLDAWYRRLLARPSVARVVEEARPYRELFPLPWPDHVD